MADALGKNGERFATNRSSCVPTHRDPGVVGTCRRTATSRVS